MNYKLNIHIIDNVYTTVVMQFYTRGGSQTIMTLLNTNLNNTKVEGNIIM